MATAAVNNLQDPLMLKHWQTKWVANPISLSQNNKAKTVNISFNVNTSTTLVNGYVDITFPASFDLTGTITCGTDRTVHGATCATLKTGSMVGLSMINLTAGADSTITLVGVKTPASAGGYGPFGITTRYF
jgi:hypothetical protein